MALSITNRGTGTHNTGATSFTLSPATNFTTGATAVLCVAADNSASGGSSNDINSVTDSIGNTWTKRQGPVFDPGAASAGVQGAIFDCEQNVGSITTSTVITVNFGSSPVAKTWTLTEINHAANKVARFRAGGDKSAGATGTAATSGASASITVGEVGVFAIFIEAGTTQTCTGDSDTSNGSWSTLQYAEIGSTTSGSCIASQAKLQTTANSAQTYDVTLGISSDYHSSYAIYQEVDAAQNVTPTAASVAMSAADPAVALGAIDLTPTAALLSLAAASPTVSLGAIDITPIAALLTMVAAAPTVDSGGSQNITPTAALVTASAAGPTVTLGAINITPVAALLTMSAAAPAVSLGAIVATPTAAALAMAAAPPTVTRGPLSVTPTAALVTLIAANPSATIGLNVTPIAGVLTLSAAAPTITLGPLDVIPTPALLTLAAASPGVTLGPLDITPAPAVLTLLAANPTAGGEASIIISSPVNAGGSSVYVITNGSDVEVLP